LIKRVVAAFAAGSAVFVVAGCSGGTDGEATPVPSSWAPAPTVSSAGNPTLPHSGAPSVTDPLPESVLSGDPCEVLTRQQVENALGDGAPQGERRDLKAVGPRCDWSDPATGGGFTVGFSTTTRQGLSAFYANAKPRMAVFRDAGFIEDFPAVEYKPEVDGIDCDVAVGLADEYAVSVQVTLSRGNEGKDACEPAKRLARVVVGNLKEKAGA
jgi:hypothetical protein